MKKQKHNLKRKPTDADFEYFKKCCLKYADLWELNNWSFRFHFEKDKKFDENFEGAKIIRDIDFCQADIYLDPHYLTDDEELKKVAKHEMIHCLLGTIYVLGRSRFLDENDYSRIEE